MQCNRDSVVKSVKSLSLDAIHMRYPHDVRHSVILHTEEVKVAHRTVAPGWSGAETRECSTPMNSWTGPNFPRHVRSPSIVLCKGEFLAPKLRQLHSCHLRLHELKNERKQTTEVESWTQELLSQSACCHCSLSEEDMTNQQFQNCSRLTRISVLPPGTSKDWFVRFIATVRLTITTRVDSRRASGFSLAILRTFVSSSAPTSPSMQDDPPSSLPSA